jgi:putative glutamine amidotransferase
LSRPLIGITVSHRKSEQGYTFLGVPESYAQALSLAGACPVLIPLGLPESTLRDLLSRMDGLLLSGGGDVDPDRYGGENHPLIESVDNDRDRVEIQLLNDTIRRGLPFLGICRGIQVINIALGGDLYADISDQRSGALNHDNFPGHALDFLAHPVEIEPASRLAQIVGGTALNVNSMHHQGIHHLAPNVNAVASAPDGIVEALELPGYPFGLAVQWHPECLVSFPEMAAIFQAFVGAAQSETNN